MDSNLSEFDETIKVRPTLLTVLCILTFIGSGWAILSNSWAYSSASETARTFSSVVTINSNDSTLQRDSAVREGGRKKRELFARNIMFSASKFMTADNIRKKALGSIISAIFTLVGAILMWQLFKKGFYVYIAGILIEIIVPVYLYGTNMMSLGITFISAFFGLLFIALYALNIKSMR
jgi:type III secretory pathway component EscR